jgi:nucleotide-binding universal stress UspA family protein
MLLRYRKALIMFKSILVAVDVDHRSSWQAAIPEAIALAQASGGKVAVVTVARDTKAALLGVRTRLQLQAIVDDTRGRLAKIVDAYRTDGIKVADDVRMGSIADGILEAARKHKADLIVMQSHRPEMLDYLIGPNAAHVAAHAGCSVLVLRQKAPRRTT